MKRKAIGIGLILALSLGSSAGVLASEKNSRTLATFYFPAYQGGAGIPDLYKTKPTNGKIRKKSGVDINVSARCKTREHNNGNQMSPNLVIAANNADYDIAYYNASSHVKHDILLRATPRKGVPNSTTATVDWHPDK